MRWKACWQKTEKLMVSLHKSNKWHSYFSRVTFLMTCPLNKQLACILPHNRRCPGQEFPSVCPTRWIRIDILEETSFSCQVSRSTSNIHTTTYPWDVILVKHSYEVWHVTFSLSIRSQLHFDVQCFPTGSIRPLVVWLLWGFYFCSYFLLSCEEVREQRQTQS